ncbi:protein croquemort-like [Topomyia yanbarensis]|uniref:protein croquemort-like n=1 Tax=Topomyia yanbarensis TaxID=2498891 RepID=UPI00273ABC16|nr:protein croquemort-like [Topomyia yanbarensis]
MCCCCNCSNLTKKVWSFVGVVLIFGLAAFFGFGLPAIVESVARSEFIMEPGSQVYDNWLTSEVPKYLDIYVWDWKNPESITNENVRPQFVERGPYVFLEDHERHDIEFNTDHSITFRQKRTWTYIPEQSKGDFYTDRVTTPHTMLMTIAKLVGGGNPALVSQLNAIIKKNNLLDGIVYKDALVRDILFDGAEDRLLAAVQILAGAIPELAAGMDIPDWDGFAYFADRNTSVEYDGIFRMGTGTDQWTDSGLLRTWNNESTVPHFRGECGKVHGSTGQVNPPMTSQQIKNPEDFILFITDVCSAFSLKYDQDVEFGGVDGKAWIGDDRVFDNGNNYLETECQCTAPVAECPAVKPGVLDLSGCKFGAPLLASFPHFYLADPSYVSALDGPKPTRELHEFRYVMHPFSGIPLEVNGRLQYNLHVSDYGLEATEGLPDITLPVFWVNQRVTLTQEKIDDLRALDTLRSAGIYTGYALLGVGIIALGVALYFSIFVWKDSKINV